jgi:hypothetical protein
MLFGDLEQNMLIMQKNFSGKHFMIDSIKGRNQPKIDCIFFPVTQNE